MEKLYASAFLMASLWGAFCLFAILIVALVWGNVLAVWLVIAAFVLGYGCQVIGLAVINSTSRWPLVLQFASAIAGFAALVALMVG